jgi:pentatricopeptide repeat protein
MFCKLPPVFGRLNHKALLYPNFSTFTYFYCSSSFFPTCTLSDTKFIDNILNDFTVNNQPSTSIKKNSYERLEKFLHQSKETKQYDKILYLISKLESNDIPITYTKKILTILITTFENFHKKDYLLKYLKIGEDSLMSDRTNCDQQLITSMMHAYSTLGKDNKISELYKKLNELNIQPDNVMFTFLINHFSRKNKLQLAIFYFNELVNHNKLANINSINQLLHCLNKNYTEDDTIAVEIEKIFQFCKKNTIKPTIITYNYIMNTYAYLRKYNFVIKYFHLLIEEGLTPDQYTFTTLIYSSISTSDLKSTTNLFNEAEKLGYIISPGLNTLIDKLSKAPENWVKLEFLFNLILNSKYQLNLIICNSMMNVCKILNKIEFVDKILEKLDVFKPDVTTYNTILATLGKSNSTEQMEFIYSKFIKSNFIPTIHTFGPLIFTFGKLNDIDKVLFYYSQLKSFGVKPTIEILDFMIKFFGRNKQLENVKDIFNQFSQFNIKPNVNIYNSLMVAYCNCKENAAVPKIYNEMKLNGVQPDKFTHSLLKNNNTRTLIEKNKKIAAQQDQKIECVNLK